MNRCLQEQVDAAVATFDLTVRYGSDPAVAGLDLRIPEGAFSVVIGPNGAGKSTLMKVLLNLIRPDQGRAAIFGLDTAACGPRVRAQIGYVPEQPMQDQRWMSCGQLLRQAAAFYPGWDHSYSKHLIERFGILLDRRIAALSKGEARVFQFVLALSHRPPLLLLDEATEGLDPVVRHRALAQLSEHMADTPTTVVLATHHVQEVESLVDHVTVLKKGRLSVQMTRDELRRRVTRYRFEVPEGWQSPPELESSSIRLSRFGREVQWTLVGEQEETSARLIASGASVREAAPLGLEQAALAFMTGEEN